MNSTIYELYVSSYILYFLKDPFVESAQSVASAAVAPSGQGYYNYGYGYPAGGAASTSQTVSPQPASLPPPAVTSAFLPYDARPEISSGGGVHTQSADPLAVGMDTVCFRAGQDIGPSSISSSAPRLNPSAGRTASLDPPPSSISPPDSPTASSTQQQQHRHRRNMSDTTAFNK